jgi:hypothetical protein
MKHTLFLISFFISTTLLGQAKNDTLKSFTKEMIVGNWQKGQLDTTFGHTSAYRFSFTKTNTFTLSYAVDKDIKERYEGKYEIVKGNILKLTINKKQIQYFRIAQVSLSFLRLVHNADKEIIELVRE